MLLANGHSIQIIKKRKDMTNERLKDFIIYNWYLQCLLAISKSILCFRKIVNAEYCVHILSITYLKVFVRLFTFRYYSYHCNSLNSQIN